MSKPPKETQETLALISRAIQEVEAQLNRSYSLIHWNRPMHYDPNCDLDDSRPTQPMDDVAKIVTKGVK
jgi:hypothetical protein